eukprot:TRINITY_DN3812_c0_g1_i7.p1 TRINITY_DN3812_c0_g1~~TRINITY_DN3812_c0_g1_i7.p1  ORF type:complete len:120 (-),score=43.49 TRINITY_DN3812_c0_g1_i7:57-416(-)
MYYIISIIFIFFNFINNVKVPLGGGLSSSASLEVATAMLIESIINNSHELQFTDEKKLQIALLCQKAEHNYASVPCGLMDQYISTFGVTGTALLLDCRSTKHQLIPFNNPNLSLLVTSK